MSDARWDREGHFQKELSVAQRPVGRAVVPPRPSEQQAQWPCRGNELGFQDQRDSVWLWEAALGQSDDEMEYAGTCHSVSYGPCILFQKQ